MTSDPFLNAQPADAAPSLGPSGPWYSVGTPQGSVRTMPFPSPTVPYRSAPVSGWGQASFAYPGYVTNGSTPLGAFAVECRAAEHLGLDFEVCEAPEYYSSP